jgi:hypothetical protein
MSTIDSKEIQKFVNHWLSVPAFGYLGSDYGQETKSLLQRPQSDGAADAYLRKLRTDVPVIDVLPAGSTNLYGVQTAPDRLDLVIEVAGTTFTIPEIR